MKWMFAGCGILSIVSAFGAAVLWFWSAWLPLPNAPGASIGATSPDDPFNVALAFSARLNGWAALMTGVSVALNAAERIGLRPTTRSAP